MGLQISLGKLGVSLMTLASSITPAGWVAIRIIVVSGVVYVKAKSKSDVDPDARPQQKKRGRELKNKSRLSDNFKPRNNKRNKRPATPKNIHQARNIVNIDGKEVQNAYLVFR